MTLFRPGAAYILFRFSAFPPVYRAHSHEAVAQTDYTDTPQYPEIMDTSRKAVKMRKKAEWHEKIECLPTVEQKMMELNMPKYYGYWSCHLNDVRPTLLGVDFVQYATRSHVVKGLPGQYYTQVEAQADILTPKIQDKIQHLIDLNFNCKLNRKNFASDLAAERHRIKNFLLGLHRVMVSSLESSVQHIKESMVDVQPRVEAFWILGGIPPDKMLRKIRRNYKLTKDTEHDLMDRPVQGKSTPCLGVRVTNGLPEVVGRDDPLATSSFEPKSILDPRSYGFRFSHKHAVTVPGFWQGGTKEHSQLWLHSREMVHRFTQIFGAHHLDTASLQKILVSSFTQALALATHLGFGPVTELTYPLVQQSVLTDGQRWQFSVYQLNTCSLHSDRAISNPHNNILWLGEEQTLFEAVDDTGVKGFNPEVLKTLISLYLKKGVERENPTPYIGPCKHLGNHPASEEYREAFHQYLHCLFSGRPRNLLKPEMYLWEKIYKVDFKTRPFEPPRRFFEDHYNKKDPGCRRLDDYSPIYIPKALRNTKVKQFRYKPKLDSEHLFKYD
ncbi:hypothetical protein OTU49_015091 [Cherax quadricarinatus]|uniref:Uncharacterized protein n=1 Tax=Cherax quadricarinatus TaxID=27406 RepID=A0AAW0YGZ0_CHEQU|nr:28S ribosomal protein S30, mitochondrial-like [Cherax quadricarinatus]